MSVSASAIASMLAATPVVTSAALTASGALATVSFTSSPPEVYTARFVTTLTAPISGLRPSIAAVANTDPAFGTGTYSISIYDAGTDANPLNFEALEVIGGGGSLNWNVVTEQGWIPLAHASGSTVIATVLTPRSITQPLNNHITPASTPDPHSIYLRKTTFTARGDLVTGTGNGTFQAQPIGTDGQVLTSDSTRPTGVRWAATGVLALLQHMGDIVVGGLLGAATRLGIGSLGQVMSVVQNPPLISNPLAGPLCTAVGSGGALINGTNYDFAYAWQSANASPDGGITAPSPITSFTATTSGIVRVQAPVSPVVGASLVVYAAVHGGTLRQQGILTPASTLSTNAIQVSSLLVVSAAASATNTTGGLGPGWSAQSIALTMPPGYAVSGSPATGTGSLVVTENVQTANTVHAGPATGAASVPGYRVLASADMPSPFTLPGEITASDFSATGITGATAGARFGGATTSGAPLTGTWSVGDFVIDQSGTLQVCTAAGTPGTWTRPFAYAQSASAPIITSSSIISTAGVTVARVQLATAASGVILQAGTIAGQTLTVINESAVANTITFATSVTSHVADGSLCVIPGLTQRTFVWNSATSLWYEQPGTSNVFGSSGPTHATGLVPDPGTSSGVTHFLREDATWATVSGTSVMAPSGPTHAAGLAPDPGAVAGTTRFLREDASWQTPSGTAASSSAASGGNIVPIQTQTPSAVGTITFTVPPGFRNLRIVGQGRGDDVASSTPVLMQFNADVGSNYDWVTLSGSNVAASIATEATTSAQIAEICATASPATAADSFVVEIPGYANTLFQKIGNSRNTLTRNDTVATNDFIEVTRWRWRSTTAITSITLSLAAGNFVNGTAVTLWGESDASPTIFAANSNLIQETVLTSAQATLPVPTIPQGYRDLRIVLSGIRSDAASLEVALLLQFNGDTGANYDWSRISNTNATVSGAEGTAVTSIQVLSTTLGITGNTSTAGASTGIDAAIHGYTGTTFWKTCDLFLAESIGTGAGNRRVTTVAGVWRNTTAITSLQFALSSGNFMAGATMRVYGEPASAAGVGTGTGTRTRVTNSQVVMGSDVVNWGVNDSDAANQHLLTPTSGLLTGTVAVTNASPTLTGAGTSFISQLAIGQVIQIPGQTVFAAATTSAGAAMRAVSQAVPVYMAAAALSASAQMQPGSSAQPGTAVATLGASAGMRALSPGTLGSAVLGASAAMSAYGTVIQTFVVVAIASNTSLTLDQSSTVTASGLSATSLNTAMVFTQPGMYDVEFGAYLAAISSGNVTTQLRLNGVTIIGEEDGPAINAPSSYNVAIKRNFNQWDYIEALVNVQNGAATALLLDERTHFAVSGRPTALVGSTTNSALYQQTSIRATGNKTTSSGTFAAIDGTNLPTLSLTLNVGDVVRCTLVGQTYNSSPSGFGAFDFQVSQPSLGTTRVYNAAANGATLVRGSNSASISPNGTWSAAEAGAHGFQPVWRASGGTQTLSNDTASPSDDTEILFTIEKIGTAGAGYPAPAGPVSPVTANLVYAGPTSGTTAPATFRSIVPVDLPVFSGSGSSHTIGAVPDPGATAGAIRFLREDATWQQPTGASGGGAAGGSSNFVPIQTQTPDNVTSVTFSIPSGFRNLRLTGDVRGGTIAANVALQMQFNQDTAANYDGIVSQFSQSVAGALLETLAGSSAPLGDIAANGAPGSQSSVFEIEIPDHRSATFYKSYVARSTIRRSTATSDVRTMIASGNWRSTAGITAVTLSLATGAFVTGSTVTLWGESDSPPALLTSNSNLIQETILTAAQASILVPNIPQGYKDLRIDVETRSDAATARTQIVLQFNGDTTAANYSSELENASSTSVTSAAFTSTAGLVIGQAPGTTSTPTSRPAHANAVISDYTGTTFQKHAAAVGTHTDGGSTLQQATGGYWLSTAAITFITVTLVSGNLLAGTTVRVYGEPASAAGPSVGTGTRLRIGSNQSIATATATAVLWDTEDIDADNQHYTSAANLTGTLAKTAASTAVVGTGTQFTVELSVGQLISVPGTAAEVAVVVAITDATNLIVAKPFVNTASGQTAARVNSAVVFRQPGMWTVELGAYMAAVSTGNVALQIRLNGTTIIAQADKAAINASAGYDLVAQRQFNQWDYVEVLLTQGSGGSVNLLADERTHLAVQSRPTMLVSVPYLCIQDQKAQNTAGGTFPTGTWQTRTLNTVVSDIAGIATLSANDISLLPGTYRVAIHAPAYGVSNHQARLQNLTDSTTVLMGQTSNSGATAQTVSIIAGKFTLTGPKTLEVQQQAAVAVTTNGLGIPANFGTEVYTIFEAWKEA